MSRTTHVLYLIVILSLYGMVNKYQDKYNECKKEYYEIYELYLDEMKEDNKAMKGWSLCLSEKADETHLKTVCDNQLYDLRDWLRKCQCKCTGFKGK
jgi:hypothetical protein